MAEIDPMQLIMWGSGRGTVESAQLIIQKHGIDVDMADGLRMLHMCVQFDNLPLLKFLCENGADTNVKTINGETPLDQVCIAIAVLSSGFFVLPAC